MCMCSRADLDLSTARARGGRRRRGETVEEEGAGGGGVDRVADQQREKEKEEKNKNRQKGGNTIEKCQNGVRVEWNNNNDTEKSMESHIDSFFHLEQNRTEQGSPRRLLKKIQTNRLFGKLVMFTREREREKERGSLSLNPLPLPPSKFYLHRIDHTQQSKNKKLSIIEVEKSLKFFKERKNK